jgi:hypothetical protein
MAIGGRENTRPISSVKVLLRFGKPDYKSRKVPMKTNRTTKAKLTRDTGLVLLLGVGLAIPVAGAEESKPTPAATSATTADLDKLVGQPAEIAPSAYLYRANQAP